MQQLLKFKFLKTYWDLDCSFFSFLAFKPLLVFGATLLKCFWSKRKSSAIPINEGKAKGNYVA